MKILDISLFISLKNAITTLEPHGYKIVETDWDYSQITLEHQSNPNVRYTFGVQNVKGLCPYHGNVNFNIDGAELTDTELKATQFLFLDFESLFSMMTTKARSVSMYTWEYYNRLCAEIAKRTQQKREDMEARAAIWEEILRSTKNTHLSDDGTKIMIGHEYSICNWVYGIAFQNDENNPKEFKVILNNVSRETLIRILTAIQ